MKNTYLAFNMSEAAWDWDDQKREAKITYTIVYDEDVPKALKQLEGKYGDIRWLIVNNADFLAYDPHLTTT